MERSKRGSCYRLLPLKTAYGSSPECQFMTPKKPKNPATIRGSLVTQDFATLLPLPYFPENRVRAFSLWQMQRCGSTVAGSTQTMAPQRLTLLPYRGSGR